MRAETAVLGLLLVIAACASPAADYTVTSKRVDTTQDQRGNIFIVEFVLDGQRQSMKSTSDACFREARVGALLPPACR